MTEVPLRHDVQQVQGVVSVRRLNHATPPAAAKVQQSRGSASGSGLSARTARCFGFPGRMDSQLLHKRCPPGVHVTTRVKDTTSGASDHQSGYRIVC